MNLFHKVYGEGEHTLMILHGLFGSSDNWSTLARRWSEEFRVILVDQRNHGRSFHDDVMDYPSMASDLVQLMDSLAIDKAHLLGHSMGGKTVMEVAMRSPQRIDKLLVADIGPQSYTSHHGPIIDALRAVDTTSLTSRGDAIDVMRTYIPNEGVLQFLAKNLYWVEKGRLDWRMNLEVIITHMDDILAAIEGDGYEGETLFIRGGKSDYIREEDIPALHEQFPAAQVQTIEEAGHWLHAERPSEFYDLVVSYLR